uniref:Serine palmitoyltransferase 1 n=1 Tax=Lygus hesperus TaxID=30085 RepID=A0A0A9W8M5_LYGHE
MDIIEPVYSLVITDLVPSFHVHLQVMLGLLVLWVLFRKSEKESRPGKAGKSEFDIINDWEPEPLVRPVDGKHRGLNAPVTKNQIAQHITVNNVKCLNFATHNYLGLVNHQEIEEIAVAAVRKYGIGSCGPRGFFGTVDVHLDLEERLAQFMRTEAAVVYSYGFSTIASAIPAYAKRGDICFVDEAVHFSIQKGLAASRSHIKYFRHNDMMHLEQLMNEQAVLDRKNPRKAAKTRKFLIVEGLYYKTGDLCPLPEIVGLKKRHKVRLFIDESVSFGTLGDTGRGVTDYYNIPIEEIDLIMSSMECSLASIGGFCVGTTFVVEHQVLSGSGYCFSASLPPLLTVAATTALNLIDRSPELIKELNEKCDQLHRLLHKSETVGKYFRISGCRLSPVKHLFPLELKPETEPELQEIVDLCLQGGVALTVPSFHPEDVNCRTPSIRLTVNSKLEPQDLSKCLSLLEKCINAVLKPTSTRSL